MSNRSIDLDIERVNRLFPFLGVREISSMDPKGRTIFPKPFAAISSSRTDFLGVKHNFLYGFLSQDSYGFYIALYNYGPPVKINSSEIFLVPISKGQGSTRINISQENYRYFGKCNLVFEGKGDHLRIHRKEDWEKR